MFLADWYFCRTIHLSIKETANFINVMLALRDPDMPVEEKSGALKQLCQMEPLNIAYALPALVDGLLAPRCRGKAQEEQAGQAAYAAAVKACIRSTVRGLSRYDYLQTAIEDLDCVSYEQLAQYLRELEFPPTDREPSRGYLEMESCSAEILALSLLRTVAGQVPAEILEIADPGAQKPWFSAALRGALGELPWALAVETLSLCGIPGSILLSYFPKDYWLCCPDKMELAARIFFPEGIGNVDRVLYEAFDLKRLTDLYAYVVNNAGQGGGLWLDAGMDKEQQKRYGAVLWQVTLWALAAEREPGACMQMLPSYWGIPLEAGQAGQHYQFGRVFQRILSKNRDAFHQADARLAVCSPWLLRKMERSGSRKMFPLKEYPELQQRHLALRAFAVPVIMCRLLRALPKDQNIPAYFLRVLLCYGDAFEFRTIRWTYYQLQEESKRLPDRYTPAIHGLLLCAYGAVRKLGTGQIDSRVPGQLVDLLWKESPVLNREYQQPRPHCNLFSESAFITAAHWAHESLSNVTFTHGIEENPWLCGGYASQGAQVCRWFFNEVWEYVEERAPGSIQRSAREATQLSFQIFPDILEESGRKAPGPANIPDVGNVSTQDLLLSNEMSFEDWMRVPSITEQRFKADAYSIALSLRLRALLTRRDDTRPSVAEDAWVSEWNRCFYSIQTKAELSRVCRYLISQFFTMQAAGPGQASTLLDACRLVIDTIAEFSNDAPFYLQHLAQELSRPLPIGDDSAALMRQSFLAALAQYMEQEKGLLPAERKKTQLLPYYMMMIADQFQSDPHYAKQLQNRRNAGRPAAFRCEREPAGAVSPGQFLNHALYHRNEDALQGLSANIQMPFYARLHNGFQNGAAAPRGEWQLGVVLSCSEDRQTRETCLSVNLGGGQAERVCCAMDRRRPDMGDLVAVKRSDPPEVVSVQHVSSQAELAQARGFEVSGSQVTVTVNGRRYCSVSRNQPVNSQANLWALRMWSPDVCAFHAMPAGYCGGACLVSLVELKGGGSFWKPEERGFHMLLAERFLSPKNPEREVTLVYIGQSAGEYLFSAAPGENYKVTEDVWEEESFRSFQDWLSGYKPDEVCGLRIKLRLTTDKRGAPRMALAERDAFDDTNVRFQNLFQDNQPLVIRRDGSKWIVPLEEEGGAAFVTAQLIRMPPGIQGTCGPASAEAQVEENGWDLVARRNRCLRVTALSVQEVTPELLPDSQLEYFLRLRAGSRVHLEQIKDRLFYGYYTGKLSSGIQVQVAAESVSWESFKNTPRLFSNREAVVENVHYAPERTEAAAVPCQLSEEALSGYDRVEGIVSRIANVPKDALSQAENLCIGVNVLLNGRSVLLKEIPRSAFSPAPKKIGEIFEARKGPNGWVFRIRPRDVSVRALWRVVDHAGESEQHADGLFLRMTNVLGYGIRAVTQDVQAPVLHLWSPVARSALKDTILTGEGRAQCIGRRFCNASVFKWGFNMELVRLVTEKGEYIGEAPSGTFPRTLTNWNSCQLHIHSVSYGQDGFQYDMRRIFMAEAAEQRQKDEIDLERFAQWQSQYDKWCEAGDFHEIGVLKRSKDGPAVFVMEGLRLPRDGSRTAPYQEWTDRVVLPDSAPLVSGRNYDSNRVRAYLHLREGGWEASIRDARPMSLTEFARYLNVSPPGRSLSLTMIFAGYDDEERLIFEWGYGFTLVVEPGRLEIEHGAFGAHDLFFGDRIKGFALEVREEDGEWLLRIPHGKIGYEVEGRVWQDAVGGVVQHLKVRRVPSTNRLDISKVSVSMPDISKAADEGKHWEFCTIRNAVLDASSASRILESLPDAEEATVLARLDITENVKHVKVLHFTALCGDLKDELREGDVLCLVSGAIEPKIKDDSPRIGNDYRITFSMPQQADAHGSASLQVSVQRRYFSYDESILRVQYRKDPMACSGYYMMVRMLDKTAGAATSPVWQGSVTHGIRRPEGRLYDWARTERMPVVTLGEAGDDGRMPVEVAPGIISHIAVQTDAEPGMLAVLRIEDGALRAESILLGDREYIPEQGRPVELLIMDGTWRKPEEGARRPSKFTIAGLPQVMFQNQFLMEREMKKEPPRFAFLRPVEAKKKAFRVDGSVPVLAGYLRCGQANDAPRIIPVSAPEDARVRSWRQLSYLDGTAEEIYAHAKRGRWYYHERVTGVLDDENRPPRKVFWPKGARFDQIPLLYAQGWRLRYTQEELPQFSFSARAVIENGLPEDGGWYPVAGSTANSLYIELMPGKIVDIPSSILVAGKKKDHLSRMYTRVFSPGDQVRLSMPQVPVGMRAKLQLTDIRFGLRGAFAEGSALLPVQAVKEGGLSLGSGIWQITVPFEGDEAWDAGGLAALRPNQPLKKITSSSEIMEGDTVLISYRNGHFFIPGLPERNLWINHDRNANGGWVDQLLAGTRDALEKLFAVLPALPVRVARKRTLNDNPHIWFAYEQAGLDGLAPGCQLPCICVGELPGGAGEDRPVLMRSGAHILKVDGARLLPGMSPEQRSEAVRFMVKARIVLWIHLDEEGWATGLAQQGGMDRRLQLLAPLPSSQGIVCREQDTLSLCWLPAGEAGRAGGADAGALFRILPRECAAVVREDRTVSIIQTQESRLQFESLGVNGRQFRVIPKHLMDGEEGQGVFRYLCQRYPAGDIFWLASERELRRECEEESPVPVEIVRKSKEDVEVAPAGTRRVPLDLAPWILAGLRSAALSGGGAFQPAQFEQAIPERFAQYKSVIQNVESLPAGSVSVPPGGCEVKLLALFSVYLKNGRNIRRIFSHVKGPLADWLEKTGTILANGANGPEEVDLLPAIAAILLLSALGGREEAFSGLAVHLARMLGNLTGGNIHQEILLEHWLLSKQLHPQGSLWDRLNRLRLYGQAVTGEASDRFDGTLTQKQAFSLTSTCGSILGRSSIPDRASDPSLTAVARALLFAAGAEADYERLYHSSLAGRTCCFQIYRLGKALTPGRNHNLAVEKLAYPQIDILNRVFSQLRRQDGLPITLNAQNMYPISPENRIWAEEACQKGIALLR